MPERDGYIPGVPCWVDTSQPDPKAATDFYGGLYGWEFENVLPEDSDGEHFIASLHGGRVAAVGSIPEGAPEMAVRNTYIWVESADQTASKARDAGGTVLNEPFDILDAGRMAVFSDPEGAVICVWEAKENKGAQVVNDPGTLNFNNLNTRDPEGAKKFYGAVFGWKTLDVGGGTESWTVDGYGDHLAPSTRSSGSRSRRPADRRASRTSSPACSRWATISQTRRRTGASPSRPTTPTATRPRRRSSAAR